MIISNLIICRQVLNTLARVSGKGNFNYQIYRLHNTTYNSQYLSISVSMIPWLEIGSNSGYWVRLYSFCLDRIII